MSDFSDFAGHAYGNDRARNLAETALTDANKAVDRAYGDGGSNELYIQALSARAQVRAQLALVVLLNDVYDRMGGTS